MQKSHAGPLEDELRHLSGCNMPLGCDSAEFRLTHSKPQKPSVNWLSRTSDASAEDIWWQQGEGQCVADFPLSVC